MRTTVTDATYLKVRRRVKELEKRGFRKVSPIKQVYKSIAVGRWDYSDQQYYKSCFNDQRKFICVMEGVDKRGIMDKSAR